MSHTLVKAIIIKDNKVYMRASANNVYPRTYDLAYEKYWTEILNKEGLEKLLLEIIYESIRNSLQYLNRFGLIGDIDEVATKVGNTEEYKKYYEADQECMHDVWRNCNGDYNYKNEELSNKRDLTKKVVDDLIYKYIDEDIINKKPEDRKRSNPKNKNTHVTSSKDIFSLLGYDLEDGNADGEEEECL